MDKNKGSKDGYTRFEKVVNYKDYKEINNLSLQAVLDRTEKKLFQLPDK